MVIHQIVGMHGVSATEHFTCIVISRDRGSHFVITDSSRIYIVHVTISAHGLSQSDCATCLCSGANLLPRPQLKHSCFELAKVLASSSWSKLMNWDSFL